MIRGTEYDLHYYSHRQFWRLVRDLSAFGWRVEIIIAPDRRRPDRPLAPNHCLVRVSNDGYGTGEDRHAEGGERAGDTPWEALSRAVEDIVNPLEAGTANHKVSRDGNKPAVPSNPLLGEKCGHQCRTLAGLHTCTLRKGHPFCHQEYGDLSAPNASWGDDHGRYPKSPSPGLQGTANL